MVGPGIGSARSKLRVVLGLAEVEGPKELGQADDLRAPRAPPADAVERLPPDSRPGRSVQRICTSADLECPFRRHSGSIRGGGQAAGTCRPPADRGGQLPIRNADKRPPTSRHLPRGAADKRPTPAASGTSAASGWHLSPVGKAPRCRRGGGRIFGGWPGCDSLHLAGPGAPP